MQLLAPNFVTSCLRKIYPTHSLNQAQNQRFPSLVHEPNSTPKGILMLHPYEHCRLD